MKVAPRPSWKQPVEASRRQRYVYSEEQLRVAIGECVTDAQYTNIGHEIVLADSFTITAPVVIPTNVIGLRIVGLAPVFVSAGLTVDCLFDIRGNLTTIDGVTAAAHEQGTSGYFMAFAKLGAQVPRVAIRGCFAPFTRQFYVETSTYYCDDVSLVDNVHSNYDSTATSVVQLHGGGKVIGNTLEENGAAAVLVVGAGGGGYTIVGNDLGEGDLDTSASDGGSILAANTNPGTKTLHADDRDDDGLPIEELADAATVDLPLGETFKVFTFDQDGAVTFTTSSRAAGRSFTLIVVGDGAAITWPAWTSLRAALPASITAGKTLAVSGVSKGTAEADIVVAWQVQP